jgi:glycosyltransferase involved in cell wall biosynthesis
MAGDVSVVIPALNEAEYIDSCLSSIRDQTSDAVDEVVVVDGGSTDGTPDLARSAGARVLEQSGTGIGPARDEGASATEGDWLLFVDADTRLEPTYVETLRDFCEREALAAASARCRVVGASRGKAMQVVLNRLFSRLRRPVLPGFNTFVRREAYDAVGGYPAVPNEDTAFSRRLAREFDTAYHPDVLVETSGRRFGRAGLTRTLWHYLRLDWHRLRAEY